MRLFGTTTTPTGATTTRSAPQIALSLDVPSRLASQLAKGELDVALIPAIDNLVKHDRRWQLWAGLVLSGLPMLFWVAFVVAEFVTPH